MIFEQSHPDRYQIFHICLKELKTGLSIEDHPQHDLSIEGHSYPIYRLLQWTASAQTHSSKFYHKRMKKSQASLDLAENYTILLSLGRRATNLRVQVSKTADHKTTMPTSIFFP